MAHGPSPQPTACRCQFDQMFLKHLKYTSLAVITLGVVRLNSITSFYKSIRCSLGLVFGFFSHLGLLLFNIKIALIEVEAVANVRKKLTMQFVSRRKRNCKMMMMKKKALIMIFNYCLKFFSSVQFEWHLDIDMLFGMEGGSP